MSGEEVRARRLDCEGGKICDSLQLNLAMEIVDFPIENGVVSIENGDFPSENVDFP